MRTQSTLNLLVIDDDQLYAERLVYLLGSYYVNVHLGFLDDKEELLKLLRQSWDALVFGSAYDLSFTDVVGIIQEQDIDLPVICLLNEEMAAASNDEGLPDIISGTMVKSLKVEQEMAVVMSICLQHDNLRSRRELKTLRYVLSEAEQRANVLIKNSKSAVAYIDQGIHIFANDPYLQLFGFESMNDAIGVPIIDLIAGGDNVKGFKQFLRRFDKGSRQEVEFEFESVRTDGSTFEAKLQLAAATLDGDPVTQVIIQQNSSNSADVAKRLAAAERKDSLTGIDNRYGFEAQMATIQQQARQGALTAGLLYIQLDNVGKIRSSLGLPGIDAAVKQVAYTLDELVSDGHVSRFSDTAFTILVEDKTTAELEQLAKHIGSRISDMLIEVDKRTTNTTVSIGIVKIEKNTTELNIVLERAMDSINQIMVETSNRGDSYHLYDPSEHANSDDHALAESLVDAIANNRFELTFQPIYDISNDRSDFFEVYLRLPLADADNTVLTPDQFMAVAKTHKLLEKIDRWVLINACKKVSDVRKTHPEARLLVQLTSASLIDKNLPNVASQLIKAVGGAAGALTLQFNEKDISDYLTVAKSQFSALSQINCQIGINNFGSSAKSIEIAGYVQPNMARLARSYVQDVDSADNLDTVKSLILHTNEVNVDVLMPYIEDAATMSVAWSVGARYLQGYYLEAPSSTIKVSSES
ncbi:EAL domain-containing protein [Psychrobacter sp. AOP22-C1-22]|uniref:EAL domain-containing protein n=1 Tax=unclassified Psychrobacter TaxID=196806 RepID=UPI001787FEBF|nr:MULTISPECIES: GGDEF domain-containing phosphodiesterase [unclassified Psychrobacter]MBE0407203.1 EAL domain-containing protein [Psychrobacter sp. FME6]MBE0443820.1 EAL domain-containing protein [Psychrobacter sp. FME5]MDN5890669.1 EAL domain-containing protein [Psychrobacter sp.]